MYYSHYKGFNGSKTMNVPSSFGEYWHMSGVPISFENVIFTLFTKCYLSINSNAKIVKYYPLLVHQYQGLKVYIF